ncbi:MAG: O-antigen ligase family protein [Fibromonadaceae bacterium]|nr:O-antigen ligase family protein [Fibromonadaceae bacterium]
MRFFRSCLAAAMLWLAVQAVAIAIDFKNFDLFSVFPRENGYHFVNMIILFVCICVFYNKKESIAWQRFAAILFCLIFLSMFTGSTFRTKEFYIHGDDSLNVWMGLGTGFLLTLFFIFLKKIGVSAKIAVVLSALFMLSWVLAPIVTANMDFWKPGMNGSAVARVAYWRSALNMFYEHPVLGVGGGSFGSLYYDNAVWKGEPNPLLNMELASTPHNEVMAVLAQYGLVGLIWQTLLFAFPLLYFSHKYFSKGSKKALLFMFGIFTALSAVEISEAPQLFVSSCLAMWLFLAFAAREATADIRQGAIPRKYNMLVFLALPVLLFLLYDRGMQIASQAITYPYERRGEAYSPQNIEPVYKAMQISRKNSSALYNMAMMHFLDKNYEQALLALDAVEEIAGTMWPIHNSRFKIYSQMGDTLKACAYAKKVYPPKEDSNTFAVEHCLVSTN